jgi:hypothetical protein
MDVINFGKNAFNPIINRYTSTKPIKGDINIYQINKKFHMGDVIYISDIHTCINKVNELVWNCSILINTFLSYWSNICEQYELLLIKMSPLEQLATTLLYFLPIWSLLTLISRNCLPFRSTWIHSRFCAGFVLLDL